MSEFENARNSEREGAPEERAFLSIDDVMEAFREWGDLDSEIEELSMLLVYLSSEARDEFYDDDVRQLRKAIQEVDLMPEQAEQVDSLLASVEVILTHHHRVVVETNLADLRRILEERPGQIIGKTREGEKIRLDAATVDESVTYRELLLDTAELIGVERAAVWRYAHEQQLPLPWMNERK